MQEFYIELYATDEHGIQSPIKDGYLSAKNELEAKRIAIKRWFPEEIELTHTPYARVEHDCKEV